MACRMSLLLGIRAGHRCTLESHLACRADRDERGGLRVGLGEIVDQRVIPFALVLVRGDESGAIRDDFECVSRLGIRGLSLHDDRAVAELHEILAGIATHVGFLDAGSERALATDRETAGGRSGRSSEYARRQHEQVVRTEWIAFGVTLLEQDPRGEGAPAQQLPLLRIGFDRHGLIVHVDSDQSISTGTRHV